MVHEKPAEELCINNTFLKSVLAISLSGQNFITSLFIELKFALSRLSTLFKFMDAYYTIEEKYLRAVDKLSYGKTTKGLKLLNEIISNDPLYARAHHQLGMIYYYEIKDYQTAGYHFKTCMELESSFPDNYTHYLDLLVFLNMEKLVNTVSVKALNTPGADTAGIYDLLGLFYEKNKQWTKALEAYQKAFMEVTENAEKIEIELSLKRVRSKMKQTQAYTYQVKD